MTTNGDRNVVRYQDIEEGMNGLRDDLTAVKSLKLWVEILILIYDSECT